MTIRTHSFVVTLSIFLISHFISPFPGFGETATPKLPPLPYPGTNPLISRIALGSCADQTRPQPVLETATRMQPDLFIYLGDNIYGDSNDIEILEMKYEVLAGKKEFQTLRSQIPTIATWDDHDYGANDSGKEYPMKEKSKEVFLKFWNEPAESPRREHAGIYTSYFFEDKVADKRLQVILLDTRTFRDPLAKNPFSSWKNDYHPDPDSKKTMLGDAQWAWLKQQLLEKADLRIIGTSNQCCHEHNGYESWTNLPSELIKMVNLIQITQAGGVVFISGDVHWGELSVLKPEGSYPLHDLTSSGINQNWDHLEPNRNRHGEACMDNNFGMIEIDWKAEEPTVSLRIHDVEGKTRVEKVVKIDELQFGLEK